MKRTSILYDYKPRLEWNEPSRKKKLFSTRKLFFAVSIISIGASVFLNYSNIPLNPTTDSLETSLSFHKTEKSSLITQSLELSPLSSDKEQTTVLVKQPVKEINTPTTQSYQSKPKVTPPFEPKLTLNQSTALNEKESSLDKLIHDKNARAVLSPKEEWKTVTVKDGDNLSLIFSRLAISKNDLYEILSLGENTQSLKRLVPGQILRLKFENSRVEELVHESDLTHTLKVKKTADEFEANIIEEKPKIQIASATGEIQDSLFLSGQKAGLSDNIIMQMFDIFGWDIDFVLDIRKEDSFRVVYEELYKNNEKIKDGKILAVEFINQGKAYKAVRYVNSDDQPGYYSEQGKSMKKAFLRTPVNFTRISSHFNLKRKHPVLNKIRAHKGVDYAAPLGTPVKSTGGGKVIFSGVKKGYGNTVIVQHGGIYTTLYAHLSRFSRGMTKGQRVKQGQTIAYVGKSGLATGPHLHYEFRVNGAHRNPLTVDLPKSLPLPKKYMKDFLLQTKPLLTQLASLSDSPSNMKIGKAKNNKTNKIDLASREFPLDSTIN